MSVKTFRAGAIASICVLAVMLVIAAIFDLNVSHIIVDLKSGEYFSQNAYGMLFEVVGEIPLYLFLSYAFCVIFWNGYWQGKGWVKPLICVVTAIAHIGVCVFVPHRINEYILELGLKQQAEGYLPLIAEALTGLCLAGAIIVAVNLCGKESVKKQLSFAVVILFVAAASQLFTQGLKAVNKRVRYRALNELGSFELFTPWYKINGYPESFKLLVEKLGKSDAVRSFPSGHTTAAGITYTLIALPFAVKRFNGRAGVIATVVCSVVYTGLVAVARIVMGAHYFSDVLVGGSAAFFCTLFAIWLIYIKRAVKPLNIYCEL